MNDLSRNIADMDDAVLFVIYIRLYQHLDPRSRQMLFQDQSRWLKARDKYIQDAVIDQGGSIAALEGNKAEAEFSEKRIGELTKRLTAVDFTLVQDSGLNRRKN
jgi:uncharacterized protein YecT (DUF1311 family)